MVRFFSAALIVVVSAQGWACPESKVKVTLVIILASEHGNEVAHVLGEARAALQRRADQGVPGAGADHRGTQLGPADRGQGIQQIRKMVGRWGGRVSIRSGTARIADVPPWDTEAEPLMQHLPHLPGAQIGIVLPETYFFSSNYLFLFDWMKDRLKPLIVANVPMEAFQGFCRAKTNFYVFEKIG